MIEAALYIALGALSISLLLFAVLPIVSGRARRLAINELERQAPVSLSEITAQKDQMRAKFAVDMNRQEKRVSKLQAETHQHQISAERWRGHAQSVEMEFDKLTDEYAATKKKFMRMEQELERQKDIAKSALKTPTGKETQARLNLESEVDQLRAEKSTASVKIVSLQTEVSNAQSRVAEMERMMPSLEELSLRKELKSLAEDVSKFVKSSPPMTRRVAEPIANEKTTRAATDPEDTDSNNQDSAPTEIPKLALKSKAETPKKETSSAKTINTKAATPEAPPQQPPIKNAEPTEPKAQIVNGMNGTNGSTKSSRLIVTPVAPIEVSAEAVAEKKSNGVTTHSVLDENGGGIKAVPPVVKLSSANSKGAKSNGNSNINFAAAKAPTKMATNPGAKPNATTGKPLKSGKPSVASRQKKATDAKSRTVKTEATS